MWITGFERVLSSLIWPAWMSPVFPSCRCYRLDAWLSLKTLLCSCSSFRAPFQKCNFWSEGVNVHTIVVGLLATFWVIKVTEILKHTPYSLVKQNKTKRLWLYLSKNVSTSECFEWILWSAVYHIRLASPLTLNKGCLHGVDINRLQILVLIDRKITHAGRNIELTCVDYQKGRATHGKLLH